MKKQEIKGLSAFELLEGLDDDMILSASLPEAVPVAPPTAGERITAFFARMGKGGMAAAVTGIVVAVAVLVGIALAGPLGVINPPDTDPSHGIHGTQPHESGNLPDTNNGIIAPPLTQNPEQEKGEVAVVSDGITVYPQGYCVWESGQHRNEQGELEGYDADGRGAVSMLDRLWDMLPVLRTAGNRYELNLPGYMSLWNVRAFRAEVPFDEVPVGFDEASHNPMLDLTLLPSGEYIVVLDIYSEITRSEDEYTKSLYEYAFMLEVDPNLDITFPVRMLIDGQTYYLEGKDGINSGHALTELAPSIRTATVTREADIDFYLSPQGTLQSVTAYDGSFRLMMTEPDLEPLVSLSAWAEGDYYFVFTVSFPFEGVSMTLEYPFHIRLVEKTEQETEEETYPNDDGETPEPPRLTVGTGFGSLHFGNTSHSREYHEGYMLWTEQWYDGGMVSGDGFGATGQLSEIADSLPTIDHDVGSPVNIRLPYSQDTLTGVSVYDKQYERVAFGRDASVLTTLPSGSYIVVLTVVTQGDYVPEAEAYERTCTEYAFRLAAAENGSMKYPETNPRVVVSGGGQSAVFETEEDGFLAWTAARADVSINWVPRVEGTPADSVIFTDDDALRALPDMEIVYGTPLTLSLGAAGDELFGVILYDAKGGVTAEGTDLSVVDTLENEGWDRGVILVLQVLSRISETEHACYEYAIDLTITQP